MGERWEDSEQAETDTASGGLARAQRTPPGDRIDTPDDDDVDYEDENGIDLGE